MELIWSTSGKKAYKTNPKASQDVTEVVSTDKKSDDKLPAMKGESSLDMKIVEVMNTLAGPAAKKETSAVPLADEMVPATKRNAIMKQKKVAVPAAKRNKDTDPAKMQKMVVDPPAKRDKDTVPAKTQKMAVDPPAKRDKDTVPAKMYKVPKRKSNKADSSSTIYFCSLPCRKKQKIGRCENNITAYMAPLCKRCRMLNRFAFV